MINTNQGLLDPNAAPQQGQPMPPQQEQPMPPQQEQPATPQLEPGMSSPEVDRDYNANPIGPEDKDELDKMIVQATKVIHTPQSRQKILDRIAGKEHPYKDIASASILVMQRIEQQNKKAGTPIDKAVRLLGGMNIVEQVTDLAVAAGKIPDVPEDDRKIITGQAIQMYYKQKMASGEISKEEAARDAHMAASMQAGAQGQNVGDIPQRINATQQLKNNVDNVAQQGTVSNTLQAPTPEANPMRPKTTMKEVLNAKGGLLDG